MNQNKKDRELKAFPDEAMEKVAGGYGGELISTGSFASQTGTSLNLFVNWSAVSDAFGQKTLNVAVSATSASLQSAALPNSVELTVNGMVYSATPNPIDYSGGMTSHPLAYFTVQNAVGPANISVAWHFNGVIGGVPVGTIWASGMANF